MKGKIYSLKIQISLFIGSGNQCDHANAKQTEHGRASACVVIFIYDSVNTF